MLQRYYKKCTYASKASIFFENNRFYLLNQFLCYSLEACLHKSGRGADSEGAAYFQKSASDAVVWAAFRERTFGGIAKSNSLSFFYENNCLFSKAASEGTTVSLNARV